MSTYTSIVARFDAGEYGMGVSEYGKVEGFSPEDKKRLGEKLIARLNMLADRHYTRREYDLAERACEIATEIDPAAAGQQDVLRMKLASARIEHAFEQGHYEAGMAKYRNTEGLSQPYREQLTRKLGSFLRASASAHGTSKAYAAAERAYRVALELDPRDALAINGLGVALAGKGDEEGAMEQWRRAIDVRPDYGPPHHNLAGLLMKRGEYEQAMVHYRRAASASKSEDRLARLASRGIAQLLWKMGRKDEATDELRNWLRKDKADGMAAEALAAMLLAMGRHQAAYVAIEPVLDSKSTSPKTRLLAAICAHKMGKNEEALAYLKQVIGKEEPDPETQTAIADVAQLGIEMRESLTSVLNGEPGLAARLRRCLARGYVTLARRQAKEERKAEAASTCRQALELDPESANVRLRVAVMFNGIGMIREATDCCRAAVALEPDFAVAHANLATLLYMTGKPDEAMTESMKALELDGKLASAHAMVALLHVRKRDLAQAMPRYREAVTLAPDRIDHIAIRGLFDLLRKRFGLADAHYALGFCYEKKGDKARARRHYQRYVDRVKEGKFVDLANERLTELKTQ